MGSFQRGTFRDSSEFGFLSERMISLMGCYIEMMLLLLLSEYKIALLTRSFEGRELVVYTSIDVVVVVIVAISAIFWDD